MNKRISRKSIKTGLVLLALLCPFSLFAKALSKQYWQTSNKTQVVFHQAEEIPMLELRVAFRAGSAYDGTHFGLSALSARMLNQGNAGQTANELAEAFSNLGAQFQSRVDRDMLVLSVKCLNDKESLQKIGKLLNQIIKQPDFPESAFKRLQKQQLIAITQDEQSPNDLANIHFFQALYQAHPYAHPVNGTKDSVGQLRLAEVKDFYKEYIVSSNASLILVGAIDSKEARSLSETILEGLPLGKPAKPVPEAAALKAAVQLPVNYPSTQTVSYLGQLGIRHQDPLYFPLIVGNYILGGGSLVSRLATEVREKRGLSYGIYSQFEAMPGIGPFLISFSTVNAKAKEALQITETGLSQFVQTGPTEEELNAAKLFINGSFPMSMASNGNIADLLLKIQFYQLPFNYLETYLQKVNAVTRQDIQKAFQSKIQPNRLLLVRVGPN